LRTPRLIQSGKANQGKKPQACSKPTTRLFSNPFGSSLPKENHALAKSLLPKPAKANRLAARQSVLLKPTQTKTTHLPKEK